MRTGPRRGAHAAARALCAIALLVLAGCAPAEPAIAVWHLLNPADVESETTRLELGVTRVECSSGVTGDVLEPIEVQYEDDRILLRTDVEPLGLDAADCQGNPVVPVTVDLAEPIGDRALVDVACTRAPVSTTTWCEDDGVRWSPPGG